MGDKFARSVVILHQMCNPGGNVSTIQRAKTICPALDKEMGRAIHYSDRLADRMRMVRQKGAGLEDTKTSAEGSSATCLGNKRIEANSRRTAHSEVGGSHRD